MKRLLTIFLLSLQFSLFAQQDFEWAIEPQYDYAMPFSCGRAVVLVNGKYGYIDTTGNFVILPQFVEAFPHFHCRATVYKETGKDIINQHSIRYTIDENGYILDSICCFDEDGGFNDIEDIFHFDYSIYPNHKEFYEGLRQFYDNETFLIGFEDMHYNVVINPQFEGEDCECSYYLRFSENLCAVKYNGKWGYIKNPLIYPPNKTASKKIVKTGNDYSVFFSVNNYNDLGFRSLTNPVSDAEKLAKSVNTIFGFDTVIYRNPTKVEIQKALSNLRKKSFGKDDQLLIYLSGHGVATNKGYFVPSDGKYNDEFGDSYYSYRDLEIDITSIPCNHILVIIDACHSSTFNKDILFGKLLAESKGTDQRPNELSEIQKFVNKTLQFKSRLVITTGVDVTFDNSAFTNLFLQKFGSFVSLNAEPVLTYDELKAYIEKNFANSDFRSFEGHEEGGSFLFIVK